MLVRRPPTTETLPFVVGPLIFAISLVSLLGGSQTPAGTVVEPWIDTSNRDAVVVAWAVEQDRSSPSMGWTGSYDACDAGTASRDLALATVARVNYYRAMAGVPASIRLNDEFSAKAQHTALTMSATGQLSHAPDDSFTCLDPIAREGAANSNLYLGRTGPAAIDGYIEDPGERNRDVGHRNTILHPPTTEMGVGHVAGGDGLYAANALWVFDGAVFADNPPVREADGFVAWPPRGFVPSELVHPRWSFGLVGADFDDATVTMTVDGPDGSEPVALDVVTRHSLPGYVPSPIIVWEPDPADPSTPLPLTGGPWPDGRAGDLTVQVVVDGVSIDGVAHRFEYEVSLVAPSEPESGAGAVLDVAIRTVGRASSLLTVANPVISG